MLRLEQYQEDHQAYRNEYEPHQTPECKLLTKALYLYIQDCWNPDPEIAEETQEWFKDWDFEDPRDNPRFTFRQVCEELGISDETAETIRDFCLQPKCPREGIFAKLAFLDRPRQLKAG